MEVTVQRNQMVGDHEQSCQIDRGSTADVNHLSHQCGLDQVHHLPFCGGWERLMRCQALVSPAKRGH